MYYVVAVDPKRHASKQRATKSDKTSGENREAEVDHPKKSEGPLKSDPPPSKRPTKTDGGGVAGKTAETGPSAAVRQPPRAMGQPPKAGQTNQPPKEAEIKTVTCLQSVTRPSSHQLKKWRSSGSPRLLLKAKLQKRLDLQI